MCYLRMGDHFVLLVDRLLTESTLEAAIESRNPSKQLVPAENDDVVIDCASHSDSEIGLSPRKVVECRICQDEDYDSKMETPCSCCGSLKIVTQADLGLADAYINGDFLFVDKKEGLLNIFMLFIANGDLKTSVSRVKNQRGWWTPMFLTAGIASAKYYFHHVLRQNTLTQARRNISRHYDLLNEHFALFLDETMTSSCAKFKMEGEDLKTAQQRKISMLIEKVSLNVKIPESHFV